MNGHIVHQISYVHRRRYLNHAVTHIAILKAKPATTATAKQAKIEQYTAQILRTIPDLVGFGATSFVEGEQPVGEISPEIINKNDSVQL